MRRTITLLVLISLLALPAGVSAAKKAETVSPGAIGSIAKTEASCPTFSWGAVRGAAAYEIVVYEADDAQAASESPQPVVRTLIPGSALAWTPSLSSCLERGRTYAWVVRALDQGGRSAWSEPRLFRVEPAPSKAEIEDALTVLRRYVGKNGEEFVDAVVVEPEEKLPVGLDAGSQLDSTVETVGTTTLPDPFTVDETGNVFGATFYGSGGGLSGVNALWLRGKGPSSFADGTHTHSGLDEASGTIIPAYVRYGTDAAVLTSPIDAQTCSGTVDTTSSCSANCSANPVPNVPAGFWLAIGGGCTSVDGTCVATGRAVTASEPTPPSAGFNGWRCSTACNDGVGGTTGATGYVVCVVGY